MAEFQIGEHTFAAARLDPRRAFHVARRLAPVLAGFKEFLPYAMSRLGGAKDIDAALQNLVDDPAVLVDTLKPLMDVFAEMKDEDVDYVLNACLSVVTLRLDQGRGWAPVAVGGQMMFDWITMPMMVQIAWSVVQQNLAGFFPAGARAS